MARKVSPDLQRRLAAIMAVDVVGSSRLIETDEGAALSGIRAVLDKVLRPAAAARGGRIVKSLGDGALLEFASPVLAVRCAVDVQETVEDHARTQPDASRIRLRIGINIGDIRVAEDGDVYGDGVNVAARLEALAEPGGICVAGKVYDELEGKLALPFADQGDQQLKGIARRVRVYGLRAGGSSVREPKAIWPVADNASRPSVAVLPFANLSGDPEQEYFADGIADDIHTALAKSRWLFVMGRSSAFAFRGKALELDEVARKLGVRYVLSGSVRRSSSKVRVAAQLIQAETGESIWAEHYDSDLTDILQMQDEITEAVAAAIEPQLIRKESERGVQRSQNLTAWDLVRRGMWHFHRFTPESSELAREFFIQATSVEPNEASGYIWLARTEGSRLNFLGTPDRDESLRVALQAAQKAVQIDPQNPYSHYAVAVAYLAGCEFENSMRAAQQAVRLNPSFALGYGQLGGSTLHCGRPHDAVDLLERGLRLSPFDPQNFVWLFLLACAYCLSRQPEKGLVAARRALDVRPNWASGLKILAANALPAGQERQAVAAWQQAAVAADQTCDLIGLMKRSNPGWVADVETKFQWIGN